MNLTVNRAAVPMMNINKQAKAKSPAFKGGGMSGGMGDLWEKRDNAEEKIKDLQRKENDRGLNNWEREDLERARREQQHWDNFIYDAE